jgi:hypothetical protein
MKEIPCNKLGGCRRSDCFHGHACQKEACRNGKVASCRFHHENHKTDAQVSEWVRPEKNKSESEYKYVEDKSKLGEHECVEEVPTESTDTWGTRIGILIDI